MTTPEQPATPPLTRRQLREIRNTGSTPVITSAPEESVDEPTENPAPDAPSPAGPKAKTSGGKPAKGKPAHGKSAHGKGATAAGAAPLARPAQPFVVPPPPIADGAVDLGVSPLTRRQARQQERIRTASVPVITPEVLAAHALAHGAAPTQEAPAGSEHAAEDDSRAGDAPATLPDESAQDADSSEPGRTDEAEGDTDKAVVNPLLGAGLLGGTRPEPVVPDFPPSFDLLLSRATGSMSSPNALIVSQSPEVSPLVAPVTATGEVLITGTFNLPDGLGSTGHANGTADGKEIDATLVDGELPSHSSPTPIAASAAVSTSKMPGEVIRPPAPEKGSRLMMSLAITAGVLALALVGVLILAFVTGVF